MLPGAGVHPDRPGAARRRRPVTSAGCRWAAGPTSGPGTGRPHQAVLLDRDGTINVKAAAGEYVRTPDELRLLPGAAVAVRRLNAAGLPTVLVTNQPWIAAAGPAGPQRYAQVHRRLVELLARDGARLDAAYHCPHERDSCDCRKPAPGMLLAAARDLGLDPARTVLVGDADSDLLAARAAGAAALLLDPHLRPHPAAPAVCPDLAAAVDHILQHR